MDAAVWRGPIQYVRVLRKHKQVGRVRIGDLLETSPPIFGIAGSTTWHADGDDEAEDQEPHSKALR